MSFAVMPDAVQAQASCPSPTICPWIPYTQATATLSVPCDVEVTYCFRRNLCTGLYEFIIVGYYFPNGMSGCPTVGVYEEINKALVVRIFETNPGWAELPDCDDPTATHAIIIAEVVASSCWAGYESATEAVYYGPCGGSVCSKTYKVCWDWQLGRPVAIQQTVVTPIADCPESVPPPPNIIIHNQNFILAIPCNDEVCRN